MYERIVKRVLDVIGALVSIVILSPVLLVTAILAWGVQGWPVLFTQRRAGYGGEAFDILKFRSMRDLRDADGNLLPDRERTTRFGRFIRATSIDELPGLWNILLGQMSFIGPRALIYAYLPYYTETEQLRHSVRPGLVGLAGVRGRNNQTWESIFAHDVDYVRRCSFWLDVRIFFETFAVVLKREGVVMTRPSLIEYRRVAKPDEVTPNALEEGLFHPANLPLPRVLGEEERDAGCSASAGRIPAPMLGNPTVTEYRVYADYAAYGAILPEVAELFTASFGREITWPEWETLYRDNPYGNAVVVAGFADGRLVAHHAMLPSCLEGPEGRPIRYLTTATLMIDAEFRRPQVFVDLMDAVHEAARTRDVPFLLGFPNARAHLPLARFAEWDLIRQSPLMAWEVNPGAESVARSDSEIGDCHVVAEGDAPSGYMAGAIPRSAAWGHPWDEAYRTWKFGGGRRSVGRFGGLTLAYRFDGEVATVFECATDDPSGSAADLDAFAAWLGAREVRLTQYFADRIGLDAARLRPHDGYVFRMYGKAFSENIPEICPSLLLSDAF